MKKTTPKKRIKAIVCASMSDVEASYGVQIVVQKMLRAHGCCPDAFDGYHRVRLRPLLAALSKIVADRPNLLDEPAPNRLDAGQEKALLDKARREQIEQENAIQRGELCTKDGVRAELEPHLEAIAAGWRKWPKESGLKIRALLQSANVPDETITQVIAIGEAGIDEPLQAVRGFLEKK